MRCSEVGRFGIHYLFGMQLTLTVSCETIHQNGIDVDEIARVRSLGSYVLLDRLIV
jgi:hypothetical protein